MSGIYVTMIPLLKYILEEIRFERSKLFTVGEKKLQLLSFVWIKPKYLVWDGAPVIHLPAYGFTDDLVSVQTLEKSNVSMTRCPADPTALRGQSSVIVSHSLESAVSASIFPLPIAL